MFFKFSFNINSSASFALSFDTLIIALENTIGSLFAREEKIASDAYAIFIDPMVLEFLGLKILHEYEGLNYKGGYFYSNIPSLNLFVAKENTKNKNPKYSPAMEKYFKSED